MTNIQGILQDNCLKYIGRKNNKKVLLASAVILKYNIKIEPEPYNTFISKRCMSIPLNMWMYVQNNITLVLIKFFGEFLLESSNFALFDYNKSQAEWYTLPEKAIPKIKDKCSLITPYSFISTCFLSEIIKMTKSLSRVNIEMIREIVNVVRDNGEIEKADRMEKRMMLQYEHLIDNI